MSKILRGGVHKYSISRVITAIAAVMFILFTGCSGNSSVNLVSIELTKPGRTEYFVGEEFDTTGMEVTAKFSDGTTVIATGWDVDEYDFSKPGEQVPVVISLTESGIQVSLTTYVKVKPVLLSGITLTAKPTKTDYFVGDKLDTAGMKVTATYTNSDTKDVTAKCTTDFDSTSAATNKTVTVSYKEGDVTKTATFTVNINAVVLKSIAITKNPTKMTYKVGEELKTDGMVVTATYNNKKSAPVTGWTTSGFDSSKAGTTEVTVSYTEGGVTQQTKIKFTVTSDARTVTFDANGGSGSMEKQTFNSGTAQALNECTFTGKTKTDYNVFTEWNTKKDGTGTSYKNKESIKITEDTTLYAQWEVILKSLPVGTDGSYGTEGTYVEFGEWPQTKKTKDVTVDENDTKTAGMNTYYKGSDGAWYVKEGTDYYKVEPIKWRVFDEAYDVDGNKGSATGKLLVAENSLSGDVPYYESHNNHRNGTYANNYMHSQIRAYLNGISYNAANDSNEDRWLDKGFFQTAFGEAAKQIIITTKVDNSAIQMSYDGINNINEEYACDPTDDKIFLLSEKEIVKYSKEAYDNDLGDTTRVRKRTDFAIAKNVSAVGNLNGGIWWLRSPCFDNENKAIGVTGSGFAYNKGVADRITNAIVPALCIDLQ